MKMLRYVRGTARRPYGSLICLMLATLFLAAMMMPLAIGGAAAEDGERLGIPSHPKTPTAKPDDDTPSIYVDVDLIDVTATPRIDIDPDLIIQPEDDGGHTLTPVTNGGGQLTPVTNNGGQLTPVTPGQLTPVPADPSDPTSTPSPVQPTSLDADPQKG
jgi:hypothetical protein